jgi:uncharacterized membrane protein
LVAVAPAAWLVSMIDERASYLLVTVLLEAVAVLLQIATGAALIRSQRPRVMVIIFIVASCAHAVAAGLFMAGVGGAHAIRAVVVALAWPLILVVVGAHRPGKATDPRRGDAAAMLLVLGVSLAVSSAIDVARELASLHDGRATTTSIVTHGAWLVTAVFALRAGLRMTRLRLLAYVVVSIGTSVVLAIIALDASGQGDADRWVAWAELVVSLITPCALWWYARRCDDDLPTSPDAAAWISLALGVALVGAAIGVLRVPSPMFAPVKGVVLPLVLGFAAIYVAVATLRERREAFALASVTAIAFAAATVGVVMTAAQHARDVWQPQAGLGIAAVAVCAWLLRPGATWRGSLGASRAPTRVV